MGFLSSGGKGFNLPGLIARRESRLRSLQGFPDVGFIHNAIPDISIPEVHSECSEEVSSEDLPAHPLTDVALDSGLGK